MDKGHLGRDWEINLDLPVGFNTIGGRAVQGPISIAGRGVTTTTTTTTTVTTTTTTTTTVITTTVTTTILIQFLL
jgi:hypothetical protein